MMEEFLPVFVKARKVTINPANKAPKKAERFTGETGITDEKAEIAGSGIKTDAIIAERVAPEVIPRIPGSANGFLKKS